MHQNEKSTCSACKTSVFFSIKYADLWRFRSRCRNASQHPTTAKTNQPVFSRVIFLQPVPNAIFNESTGNSFGLSLLNLGNGLCVVNNLDHADRGARGETSIRNHTAIKQERFPLDLSLQTRACTKLRRDSSVVSRLLAVWCARVLHDPSPKVATRVLTRFPNNTTLMEY